MALPALPREIIYEILSRTSLLGLGRCRLVSKEWNSMTYESDFMKDHCRRTKTISGLFRQNGLLQYGNLKLMHVYDFVSVNDLDRDNEISLKFLPAPSLITAATKQGILLCVNEQTRIRNVPEYYVCKPTTREWHTIPNPKTRYLTGAIAMVVLNSKPLRYKIVRVSLHKGERRALRCEVLDSETWVWKRLEDVLMPSSVFFTYKPVVPVGGRLYWLMNNKNVFEFREDTESWSTFELPYPACEERDFRSIELVDYEAHLAIINWKEDGGQLWVLEDIDGQVWRKREIISPEHEFKFLCMYGSDAIFWRSFRGDKYCNFKSFKSKLFERLKFQVIPEVFPFQSDFEPINLQRIMERRNNYRQ